MVTGDVCVDQNVSWRALRCRPSILGLLGGAFNSGRLWGPRMPGAGCDREAKTTNGVRDLKFSSEPKILFETSKHQ
jgi:hypothetical protein